MARTTAAGILIMLALPFGELQAQGGERSDEARQREECRLAKEVLDTGYPHPRWERAMDFIARCRPFGAEAIANAWAAPPTDPGALAPLVRSSRAVRDARILEAVLDVARSEAAERAVRFRALQVLTAYVDPRLHASLEDFEPTDLEPWERPGLGTAMHVVTYQGGRPPPPDTPRRIVDALAELAETAADERVRYAAEYLRDELGRRIGWP